MTTLTMAELRDAGRRCSAADHAGTIRAFYPFWDTRYRPFLIKAVEAVPADRFDFKPHPELLTAHQMILHIAEAERVWIHHVVEGGPFVEWVVPHPDPGQGWRAAREAPDHRALLTLLEESHRLTQRWLERPSSELDRLIHYRNPEGTESRFTLHWVLDHVQKHENHHRAQLYIYLRLMGVKPPTPE